MNAGIVILEDGTPCIAYDQKLPQAISHVEFNSENFQITLVYAVDEKTVQAEPGMTFDFPLDHPFVDLLRERKNVAVACVEDKQLVDIKVYNVIFVQKPV